MARSLALTARQINLLEVCGFDLLAQVEALLRYSREYQRELHRLERAATNATALPALRRQIRHLCEACTSLQRTMEVITDTDRQEGTPAEPEPLSKAVAVST